MIKIIKNKSDYIHDVVLDASHIDKLQEVILFGKKYFMYDDFWMHHVHLKVSDMCNAKCEFCIEKHSNIKENKEHFIKNLKMLLEEMNNQKILNTVSITGGEPGIYKNIQTIIELLQSYGAFININTNGRVVNYKNFSGWINISKHNFDDSNIFKLRNLEEEDIKNIKVKNPESKIRFQCVFCKDGLTSVEQIKMFIKKYSTMVNDFSFRSLMKTNESDFSPLFFEFRDFLFDNAEFVEQVIQDYYVYETYKLFDKSVTISYSNMKFLTEVEQTEPSNMLREIIVHPDGWITGDWSRKTKIILK